MMRAQRSLQVWRMKATSRLYNPGDVPPSTHSNGVQGYDFTEYNKGELTVWSDENKFGLKAWSIGCLSLKPSIEKLNSLYSTSENISKTV